MDYELILLAAGQSRRMVASTNKILLCILDRPVIEYSLETFLQDEKCLHIVLVVEKNEQLLLEKLISEKFGSTKTPITIVVGGMERQDSVYNGLATLKNQEGFVLIHDGARPFIEQKVVDELVNKMTQTNAAIVAVPVKDTIKCVHNQVVEKTIPRESLWQVQTPQGFLIKTIKSAHQNAKIEGFFGTDDASLVEHYGGKVAVVTGDYDNIKLTTPEDMLIGEAVLLKRRTEDKDGRKS
ncbi:2-C-methyl-D-erythritol 4-phosphate cytidylyltransferase [Carnobacterium divergens]|uniref:2-C-methyl-D-erythritol 4-phosphate cytidylyltransferase n=2 Tax=Carnobacterium divergens TaxID=2748 RepID=A0A0R2HW71_CARDV|nr:2-C-methyl-D-erythritol 4-phosphate cytidylyltransferase [Carnobacterium divergens]ANZ98959.1 2-C-methyl-D-erythritol 4-phosphate cytidylyltransferase [Carnobacterium divergens]KRN56881.1 2-C-methyl-D-erythritol 4-phosphate cytidylyltransferase [Carnobacterium divergens DSM 20623]MDO0874896.1 2-C-methyl-D-erythritol 4-phosphate cytidylyltransferase [Carnobacterium divergens]MDT1958521.1 2-C-methyl-D-erythritol 4-phosphate cytidylyltransferase [Carnobacterium divergens]MDT1974489.1 2-C-methy